MSNSKISRDELLWRCANTFKRLGYHGTSMDALATACGLTKGAFYHHYPSKETLARDVLKWSHEQIKAQIFQLAYQDEAPALDRLTQMHLRARQLFSKEPTGCLFGMMSVDTVYAIEGLVPLLRAFFDDWTASLAHVFSEVMPSERAQELAQMSVADYEGAVLMARLYDDISYFDRVSQRLLSCLP